MGVTVEILNSAHHADATKRLLDGKKQMRCRELATLQTRQRGARRFHHFGNAAARSSDRPACESRAVRKTLSPAKSNTESYGVLERLERTGYHRGMCSPAQSRRRLILDRSPSFECPGAGGVFGVI